MKHTEMLRWAGVAALALSLTACGKSDADRLAAVKDYLAKNDTKAAVVELKSTLQKSPQLAEARYLLGKTLLASGDPVAAAVELQKAADLKYDSGKVLPVLARALVEQGEGKKLLANYGQFPLADPVAFADLKASLAAAYVQTNDLAAAQRVLDESLKLAPQAETALLLQARLFASRKAFGEAQTTLDDILKRTPTSHEAWVLKGDVTLASGGDQKEALDAFRKALQIKPSLVNAHKGVVELLLAGRDIPAMTEQVAAMKKVLPNHPQTQYFEGILAYLGKDFKTAKEISQKLLQATPNNPLALQLAGATEYQLRNFQQAETLLMAALGPAPGLRLARITLAQTQLRTGQAAKALATLAPLLETPSPSAEVLAVAAEAHLQNGDAKKSDEIYARALKLTPDDARIRTARAVSQVRQGKGDSAMGELEALAATDANSSVADMALISAHLRRGQFDAALKAVDALEKKQPDKAVASNLRGRVLALKKDFPAARASFERSLSIDKTYLPALSSLAALDLAEKKPEQARKRFDDYIKGDPKNVNALLTYANLLPRVGGTPADVVDVLTKAVQVDPSQPGPRLRLIEQHVNARNIKAALDSALESLSVVPDNPELLQALGGVYMLNGNPQQAITSYNKLLAARPDSTAALIAIGEAYWQNKQPDQAVKSLTKALSTRPDLLPAQRGLLNIAAAEKRYTEAIEIARQVQKQRPEEAVGYMMEGDVEKARRSWDAAAAAYRASLQKQPSTEGAVRMHSLFMQAGRQADADRFAASWEKDHPKDVAFVFYRGDLALQQKNFAEAESRYRTVSQLQPQNALALNNVAWLMVKQSKPGALPFAEKATELMPNQPALMDTLSLALAAEKRLPQALEVQKKAVALSQGDPSMRLNLARLLVQAGEKSAARTELQALEKLGTKFPDHGAVVELLKTVS